MVPHPFYPPSCLLQGNSGSLQLQCESLTSRYRLQQEYIVKEEKEKEDQFRTSITDLYAHYCSAFCPSRGQEPKRRCEIGKMVRKAFPTVSTRRLGPARKQESYYCGIIRKDLANSYKSLVWHQIGKPKPRRSRSTKAPEKRAASEHGNAEDDEGEGGEEEGSSEAPKESRKRKREEKGKENEGSDVEEKGKEKGEEDETQEIPAEEAHLDQVFWHGGANTAGVPPDCWDRGSSAATLTPSQSRRIYCHQLDV